MRLDRRSRAGVVVIVLTTLAVTAAGACTEDPAGEVTGRIGEGHYRWEGIEGFAIWPEDQPEDGLAACEDVTDEPWRADPGAVAEEFVRSVLEWPEPPDLSDHDVRSEAPRTSFSMTDGSMSEDSLGVVVHLRRLRGCWFVAAVWPREGDAGGTYDWVKQDDRWVLRASWKGEQPIKVEVGWGDEVEVAELERGERADFAPPDPDMPGHILWFYDEPSTHTFGQPLSPAPRIP